MPKKRSIETSPEYGTFIVTLLYNTLGYMASEGKENPFSRNLEKSLSSIFRIPEVKEFVLKFFDEIISTPESDYKQPVQDFFIAVMKKYANLPGEVEGLYPPPPPSENESMAFVLEQVGFQKSFGELVALIKSQALEFSELFKTGNDEALEKFIENVIAGTFSEDPKAAISMIKFALLVGGGTELIDEIDTAVLRLKERLLSSPEFSAAVETQEKPGYRDGSYSGKKYEESWKNLKPNILGRIQRKGLLLPRIEFPQSIGQRPSSHEEILAMECVFSELINRVTENPTKLIQDAWAGKLANSIVLAVEHDIRDAIRSERAQKRGIAKTVILEEDTNGPEYGRDKITGNDLVETLESFDETDSVERLLTKFSPEEREIVTLIAEQSLNQQEIAKALGKSQPWVSKRMKGIKEKLQEK